MPYYGPSKPFRAIVNGAGDHFSIPAKLAELEEREASAKNIAELKNQLSMLNKWIEGPKYMTEDTKGREVYFKDAGAYYDPTMPDKLAKKASLQALIASLEQEMKSQEVPALIIGKMKANVKVQNFVNTNKEETNEFIAKSYYYPVDRSTLANRQIVRVEAESTGVQADKRFYMEEKKVNNNAQVTNAMPSATAQNKMSEIQSVVTGNKVPNTQGLKTSAFRIVSLRRNN